MHIKPFFTFVEQNGEQDNLYFRVPTMDDAIRRVAIELFNYTDTLMMTPAQFLIATTATVTIYSADSDEVWVNQNSTQGV